MALSTSSTTAGRGGGRVIYPVTPNGVEHIVADTSNALAGP